MKTPIKEKIAYSAPLIERIQIDNEITLALESSPPNGPGEPIGYGPGYLNNDPFKNTIC